MDEFGVKDIGNIKSDMVSEYNEAKLQIYRLHLEWIDCNKLSQKGNFDQWNWHLDTIWRELSPKARKKGGEDLIKNDYFMQMNKLNLLINKNKKEFTNLIRKSCKNIRKLRKRLNFNY